MENPEITIKLKRDEALVLYDFLSRSEDDNGLWEELQKNGKIEHVSEKVVLWRLQGFLEIQLHEMFLPNYKEIISNARISVKGENDYV